MIRKRYNYLTPSKTAKGKKDALKVTAPQSKHCKQKAKRTISFPKIGQTVIRNEIVYRGIHAKTYNGINSKPQQKHHLGTVRKKVYSGTNRFNVATTLALCSAMVNTRHLFSPREGFLTRQCNISENIKIKRIQKWNNDEDSTARNNWNAEAKANQQLDQLIYISQHLTSTTVGVKCFVATVNWRL